MKVAQSGFPVVALMGSSLSKRQEELLVQRFKRVALMLDGDEAEYVRKLRARCCPFVARWAAQPFVIFRSLLTVCCFGKLFVN